LWVDEDVVLAFHRLVVVDPAASRQPLLWGPLGEPDRYAIALNGEVYNHAQLRTALGHRHGARFATGGDAEAVAAALHFGGADAVAGLRGMFAFTAWDRRERRLVVARDRFGIKPLYHLAGPRGHAFASGAAPLRALAGALGLPTAG